LKVNNGQENIAMLPEKYADIGGNSERIHGGWSADGKKVIQEIYMECETQTEDYYCYKVAFVIINVDTGEYQLIDNDLTNRIGENNQWKYEIGWLDGEHIQLMVNEMQKIYEVEIPR
jgi:hypothetical protein